MRALPKKSKFFKLKGTLRGLMMNHNSFRMDQDDSGGAAILAVPIYKLGSDEVTLKENVSDSFPEIHKALSVPGYTVRKRKNDTDFSNLPNFSNYIGYTGHENRPLNREIFFKDDLLKKNGRN